MAEGFLDFEKPIAELERKIDDLRQLAKQEGIEVADELKKLEKKADKLRSDVFSRLTRWQRVQVARHPLRPNMMDYVDRLMDDFIELHGDRLFSDDAAIIAGLATFEGRRVVVIGQQKGRSTEEKLKRNFGMAHPEGYRKSLRMMHLAAKFGLPVLTFVDTMGAFPGIEAEERGQARAIAESILVMSRLRVPIVVSIIGEGGSGGALAIAVGDRVLMLENSIYSVISPEGCAAILWKDRSMSKVAAEALRVTAPDLNDLNIIDSMVTEPPGGAHRDVAMAAENLRLEIRAALKELVDLPLDRLLEERAEKYMRFGAFTDPGTVSTG